MSPEQLHGGAVDARSDIFSFGAVLYEMLTGKRAFEGSSQASIIAAILERDPPPLAVVGSDSSRDARQGRSQVPREGSRPTMAECR